MSNQPINLELFCNPSNRGQERPFSTGEWSYATNGWIVVRIPRRDDIAENPDAPNEKVSPLFDFKRPQYKPAPKFELSEPFEWDEEFECYRCRGGRKEHDCPDCKCKCSHCGGTGKYTLKNFKRVKIGSVAYNSKYIAWLQLLPDLEIGQTKRRKPLAFRFHGGEGLLMPLEG